MSVEAGKGSAVLKLGFNKTTSPLLIKRLNPPSRSTASNNDAFKFINSYSLQPTTYNLVLVDLYLGNKFPIQAESPSFLKNLKKLLAKNGVIIFNRLFEKKDKKQVKEFINKLGKYFSKIELIRAWSNLLVVCRR